GLGAGVHRALSDLLADIRLHRGEGGREWTGQLRHATTAAKSRPRAAWFESWAAWRGWVSRTARSPRFVVACRSALGCRAVSRRYADRQRPHQAPGRSVPQRRVRAEALTEAHRCE